MAVSPPQVGAGICRDLVQIRPELSPVRIGVEVPYRLQEGLLRRILRRLPVRRVPQAVSEYGRIGVDYKLLQRRPVTPAQPPEQLVFPRQNTTSRRERPLTEYNARAAENDWRREIFLKPHFAPRRSKSAQTRLVPAVPSLVQVFGGFHIQLSAVAPVFIAGSSRAFCRSCPPDRSARCRTPARQNARRQHAAAHDTSRASKAPYLLRRRSRLAKGGKLPAENISLKAGRGTSH